MNHEPRTKRKERESKTRGEAKMTIVRSKKWKPPNAIGTNENYNKYTHQDQWRQPLNHEWSHKRRRQRWYPFITTYLMEVVEGKYKMYMKRKMRLQVQSVTPVK